MDYFAGLDISMDETHVCVLDREGMVVRESKTESTAQAVANELAKAPSCRRIVFETGRMAPILFHGLNQLGPSGLRREPAGLPGAQVARHPQDRPQRRARSGASGPRWLLQARACEVAASSCAPLVEQRAQKTGRPAGDLGKSDPRPGGRVRDPTAPRSPQPSSTRLLKQARGSLASLSPCGD